MIVGPITGVKSYVGETGKSMKAMELGEIGMELAGASGVSRTLETVPENLQLSSRPPRDPGCVSPASIGNVTDRGRLSYKVRAPKRSDQGWRLFCGWGYVDLPRSFQRRLGPN